MLDHCHRALVVWWLSIAESIQGTSVAVAFAFFVAKCAVLCCAVPSFRMTYIHIPLARRQIVGRLLLFGKYTILALLVLQSDKVRFWIYFLFYCKEKQSWSHVVYVYMYVYWQYDITDRFYLVVSVSTTSSLLLVKQMFV